MNLEEAIAYLFNLARQKSLGEFDITGYDSFSESVEVFEGKISNTEIARSYSIGIRILHNHRPGIAFTEKLSPDALKLCLDDALAHTQLTDPVAFALPKSMPPSLENYDRVAADFATFDLDTLASFATTLEAQLRSADKRIENVPYTGASRSSFTSYFLNSHGIRYTLSQQDFGAYTAALAAAGAQKKLGIAANSRLSFSELSSLPLVEQAKERALSHLGAKPVTPGNYTVLFSNRVSGQIFSLYQSAFFAEMALRGQSRLMGKLGEQIASPCVSLFSVARDKSLRGSRALDSEGIPTHDVAVIAEGKFDSFLYNLEAAALEKKSPTGNAVRSPASKAGTAFMNLVVAAGKSGCADLLSSGRILLIDKLEGASGCSAVSGEFSIGAQGFLCENGRMLHPVDGITLSSNFFDMLRNVIAVSCEYNDQYSSIRVPDLLISGIAVAA